MSSQGKNPFLDDDEVDDYEFLSHPLQGHSGYVLGTDPTSSKPLQLNEPEARQRLIMDERRRIEERTLQSTYQSLGLIHDSEQMGISTAEELVQQREKLQNVEKNLDSINSTMRISQKHINSIKSMFGGIKSFFGGSGADDPSRKAPVVSPTLPQNTALQDTIDGLKATEKEMPDTLHPGLRVRGVNLYDNGNEFGSSSPCGAGSTEKSFKSSFEFEEKFDRNLSDISEGIGRLKNLAIGLNEELEDHSDLLERINSKAEHADGTLAYQNRQIKRILKK